MENYLNRKNFKATKQQSWSGLVQTIFVSGRQIDGLTRRWYEGGSIEFTVTIEIWHDPVDALQIANKKRAGRSPKTNDSVPRRKLTIHVFS